MEESANEPYFHPQSIVIIDFIIRDNLILLGTLEIYSQKWSG
jgi:hypothetical protein